MNLFETTLRLKGFPITAAKARLEEIDQINPADYETYVKKLRTDIFEYHLRENEMYQDFIGEYKITDWNEIPVMHKSDLQKPLADRLSNGFSEKNTYINKTSGSSGTPFIFAKDKFCHALSWAEFIAAYSEYGIDFRNDLQARFYGIPLDRKGYLSERLKDLLGNRFRFPVFDLSEKKMEYFLKVFRRKKFSYINGYTSSIVFFAKFLKGKNIVLKNVCPTLKHCIVTSEMLFKEDKILMEKSFGVSVINEYGASELGLIAFTNEEGRFAINSSSLFIEILDENDKPIANGKEGKIVITSLYNKAHPMIRYEIGDMGVLSEKSTFKKPILKKLVGRTNEFAKLPSGKTVPALTFYYITKNVIENDGNVKEFTITQKALDVFEITYVSEKILSELQEELIKKAFSTYLEENLKVIFKRVLLIKRTKSGKLKQFTSEI